MTVGAQHYFGVGPVGADRPQQAAQEGLDLLAARPFGGTKTAVMKRPSPSNTTIG